MEAPKIDDDEEEQEEEEEEEEACWPIYEAARDSKVVDGRL